MLLDIGGVFVDGRRVKIAGRPMHKGEEVVAVMGGALARATQKTGRAAARDDDERQLPAFAVVFEDDDIVVVDKPSGLLTAPTPESDRNNLADLLTRRARRGPGVRRPPHRSRDQRPGRVREDRGREPRAVATGFATTISSAPTWPWSAGAFPDELKRRSIGRWAGGRAVTHVEVRERFGDRATLVALSARDRPDAPDPAAHGRGRNAGDRRRALRAAVRAGAAPDGAARDDARLRPPADGRAAVVREPVARRIWTTWLDRNNVAQHG